METNGPTITKELKSDIEINQIQLINAIRNHQALFAKAKAYPEDNEQLLEELKGAEEYIIRIGIVQKGLLIRLREEYQNYQNNLKTNVISSALEERRQNLAASLNRARKQNLLPRSRRSPPISPQNEFENLRPESPPQQQPTVPQDVAQPVFMGYFRLVTHEVFGEMQRKRAERKRRSTANPHFVYGNRGWDFFGPPTKRKRKFLARPASPPQTRGRKRQELAIMSNVRSVVEPKRESSLPTIPNLPNGLVIERVSPGSTSPDAKQCIVCKQPGALSICNRCSSGFHVSCHNRPFSKMPRECPKCLKTDGRRSASASSSNSASSSCSLSAYSSPTDITEKVTFKQELEEKRNELTAEMTQLQNRHSELTIAMREQEETHNRLRSINEQTNAKVQRLIEFIQSVQSGPVPETSQS